MFGVLGITREGMYDFLGLFFSKLEAAGIAHPCLSRNVLVRMADESAYRASISSLQEDWPQLMVEDIRAMEEAGVTAFVCPANSNHAVYEKVVGEVTAKWLHIVDPVAACLQAQEVNKVLLLGTTMTVSSKVYPLRMAECGYEVVTPEASLQAVVNVSILSELTRGDLGPLFKQALAGVAELAQGDSFDAIVLGCTELQKAQAEIEAATALPVVDSSALLAEAAVNEVIIQQGLR